MDVAIISPPRMLELSDLYRPGFGMVLPEGIICSEDYIRFYNQFEGYKILDNGIVEGRQFTGVELHHMAYEVGANCVVVPDQFRDADTTIRMARDFKRNINPELDYMGVLQGLELGDVLRTLYFFNQEEWITHVGLPRILCEFHKMQRVTLADMIKDLQNVGVLRKFKVHALGASSWVKEVTDLADAGCDSMDTSLPVVFGLEGYGLDHEYTSRKNDFMEQDVDRQGLTWRKLVDNCLTYLHWAGIDVE